MRKFFIILLFPIQLAMAQTEITLDNCYQWARDNHPKLGQSAMFSDITQLKLENIKTNHLPKATLKGQATYQSEVTKIEIPLPNMDIPSISKDQYKVFLDFQQNIWDGGLSESQKLLEEAALASNISQLEIELYQLNNKINQAWFIAINALKNKQILETQKLVLSEKIKAIESGIKNGVVEAWNKDALEVEILSIDQKITEVETGYSVSLKILTIYTGKEIDHSIKLVNEPIKLKDNIGLSRPELKFFDSQINQLSSKVILLEKQRNPKIYGFGQGGIGRPGLNMLNNDFNPYYLVGLGMSWNPFDWKKTAREKQIINLQKNVIKTEQETFEQTITILLEQQLETIQKTKDLIKTDRQIISLRDKIAKSSASKFENGIINSTDYVTDLNMATIAKLKLESHKIKIQEAIIKYNTIKGVTNNE